MYTGWERVHAYSGCMIVFMTHKTGQLTFRTTDLQDMACYCIALTPRSRIVSVVDRDIAIMRICKD